MPTTTTAAPIETLAARFTRETAIGGDSIAQRQIASDRWIVLYGLDDDGEPSYPDGDSPVCGFLCSDPDDSATILDECGPTDLAAALEWAQRTEDGDTARGLVCALNSQDIFGWTPKGNA